jgi:hypothetical protein
MVAILVNQRAATQTDFFAMSRSATEACVWATGPGTASEQGLSAAIKGHQLQACVKHGGAGCRRPLRLAANAGDRRDPTWRAKSSATVTGSGT